MKYFLLLFLLLSPLCPAQTVTVDGVIFESLSEARPAIKDGSRVYLEKGIYAVGAYIKASNIEIIGEKGVVFDDAVADNKAALVFSGDNVTVESIECRNIQVNHKNGACIRFEGTNLTVRDLYAHDSQSGVMTSDNAGTVKIEYSKFERLGGKASGKGYAHAMYIKADTFTLFRSEIVDTQGEGSGVKSRSNKTLVLESLLSSGKGNDSRLVDVANFGELIVQDSILQQGNKSSNSQLIAYGLEKKVERKFPINRIQMSNNIFIFDRIKANVLISYRLADEVDIKDNIYIGDMLYPDNFVPNNKWYFTRKDAFIAELPYIPKLSDFEDVKFRTEHYGTLKQL